MRGWSFPLGRWFGVEFRIHAFFLFLLVFSLFAASVDGAGNWRGLLLWLMLLFAVLVRELARILAASVYRVGLRKVLLLPIGGLFSYADPESAEQAGADPARLTLASVGIAANLLFALILAALIHGASPAIHLFGRPWVTPLHLLRSSVWISLLLALINGIPAYPLDAGRLLEAQLTRRHGAEAAKRTASSLSRLAGLGTMLCGLLLLAMPASGFAASWGAAAAALAPWLVLGGFFIAISAQLEDQGVLFQSVVDTVKMRDVMLTDFSTLSPSDTLQDALQRSIHSLQDDFPVVRGDRIVGVISRQSIAEALRGEGNGYVQGIMTRAFQVAGPEDSLGAIIRRMRRGRMALVPIAEGERIVGVVTLQNLMHSMGPLAEERKLRAHG